MIIISCSNHGKNSLNKRLNKSLKGTWELKISETIENSSIPYSKSINLKITSLNYLKWEYDESEVIGYTVDENFKYAGPELMRKEKIGKGKIYSKLSDTILELNLIVNSFHYDNEKFIEKYKLSMKGEKTIYLQNLNKNEVLKLKKQNITTRIIN